MAYVNCIASVLMVGAFVGRFMVNYGLLESVMAYVNCIASVLVVGAIIGRFMVSCSLH